jgi:hypothetical protein
VGDAMRAAPPRSASDDWGPYRARIEEQVASCADYLGPIRRSLAGAIAGDRTYVAEKAQELMSSAKRLARLSQDVERWLGECGADFEAGDPGDRYLMACGWPAGHEGPHGERSTPPAQRASDQARRVADRVEQISQRLGRLFLDVDTDLAVRRLVDDDDRRSLDDLADDLQRASLEASSLANDVQRIGPDALVTRTSSYPGEPAEAPSLGHPHRHPPDDGLGL